MADQTSPPLATPTILQSQDSDNNDDKKGLTSGQIGAILATITILFILLLASLHLYLSRRRRRLQHHSPNQAPHIYSYYNDDSSELDSDWSSRATRQNIRVRETVERVDVNWADDRRRGNLRRAPERHQIRSWERTAPVYSNVRHVRRPEAGYFRS